MADKSKAQTFGSDFKASVGGTTMLVTESSLKAEYEWYEPSDNGFIGTDKPANTGRQVTKKDVKGVVNVQPSYANANALLALCFDETTGTFTPADNPESIDIDVVVDRGVDVYTYADAWLNMLTISGAENEPLSWAMDIMGQDEADSGTVAALTVPDRMLFSDLTFSINANQYFITSFSWAFSYDLTERFHNSITRSSVAARIPRIDLSINIDLNSDNWGDVMDLAGTDTALADVNLVFTDGANTVSLLHPEMTVISPDRVKDASGVDSQNYDVNLRAWLASGEGDIFTATYA